MLNLIIVNMAEKMNEVFRDDLKRSVSYLTAALDEQHAEKALFWALSLVNEIHRSLGGKMLPPEVIEGGKSTMQTIYETYIIPR